MNVRWVVALFFLGFAQVSWSAGSETTVPMAKQGAATFYVGGNVAGLGATHFMVDTGSGYTVINKKVLEEIVAGGHATYLRKLQGIMADGSSLVVSVYRVDEINIGGNCVIRDVEVAVLPRARHPILGLSALQKVAPFVFSVDPPNLHLSNCQAVRSASKNPSASTTIARAEDSDSARVEP